MRAHFSDSQLTPTRMFSRYLTAPRLISTQCLKILASELRLYPMSSAPCLDWNLTKLQKCSHLPAKNLCQSLSRPATKLSICSTRSKGNMCRLDRLAHQHAAWLISCQQGVTFMQSIRVRFPPKQLGVSGRTSLERQ